MIKNLKVLLTDNVLETFFLSPFSLDLSFVLKRYRFLTLNDKLGHLMCEELHIISSDGKGVLD